MNMNASKLQKELSKNVYNFDREHMIICKNNNGIDKSKLVNDLYESTLEEAKKICKSVIGVNERKRQTQERTIEFKCNFYWISNEPIGKQNHDEVGENKTTLKSIMEPIPAEALSNVPVLSSSGRGRKRKITTSMDDAVPLPRERSDSGIDCDLERRDSDDGQRIQCEFCFNYYARRDSLWRHQTDKHHEEFSFHCSTCERGFKNQSDADEHEKKHMNAK
ncbi:zinc finger protein YER130C-like isoform X2 [Contarinia nasturtii]|uniref:zinc finger protein YER130C-like isoform X2 n=1 Tax=Contarinia nasturtii TaxID=265458 RepID=UPI0012D3863F|nr:zinc finger protein YER130C-like isoform X2 [Contarinia nasturtii]